MLRLTLATVASFVTASAAFAGTAIPPTAVPEPASLAVLAAGAGGVLLYRRLRK